VGGHPMHTKGDHNRSIFVYIMYTLEAHSRAHTSAKANNVGAT